MRADFTSGKFIVRKLRVKNEIKSLPTHVSTYTELSKREDKITQLLHCQSLWLIYIALSLESSLTLDK